MDRSRLYAIRDSVLLGRCIEGGAALEIINALIAAWDLAEIQSQRIAEFESSPTAEGATAPTVGRKRRVQP